MIHLSPSFPQGSRSKLRARTVSYLTPGNNDDAEKATVTKGGNLFAEDAFTSRKAAFN